ncbi:hypothetical protein ElyMa_004158600 [Elysia marginata]|uniref:Uncharacterized protein n=1 Tax=Elysia marginata TaxID=1093978 RepID=A0AAV4GHL0_9GAST|nr:hypothetical protein ElyMa_004158600 [Elysia marginata]
MPSRSAEVSSGSSPIHSLCGLDQKNKNKQTTRNFDHPVVVVVIMEEEELDEAAAAAAAGATVCTLWIPLSLEER